MPRDILAPTCIVCWWFARPHSLLSNQMVSNIWRPIWKQGRDLQKSMVLTRLGEKKNYRLRFCWNSQKWSFRTISRRRFWLEINRGPLLLKPSFWNFWFVDEIFSKIKIFRFFEFFDFSLISLRKWPKKSKNRKIEKSKKPKKSRFSKKMSFRFFGSFS